MKKAVLAVTLGDPAGIGPEVVLKSLRQKKIYDCCRPLVIGDAQALAFASVRSGLQIHPILNPAQATYRFGTVDVLHVPCPRFPDLPAGPSAQGGEASAAAVRESLLLARSGIAAGVVHAPISKSAWKMAGIAYPGHTEMIADFCRTKAFAMAIASEPLRTVLVTRHLPLRQAPARVTQSGVLTALELAVEWMRQLELRSPRIGICALNPHAGEGGILGTEELRVLSPALQKARRLLRAQIAGPLPADSAFRDHKEGLYDCLITMYHDQSLVPLKLHNSEKLVNITLGLPFVRTSPGHGTAFDIAGKDRAHSGPMTEAILTAAKLCRK